MTPPILPTCPIFVAQNTDGYERCGAEAPYVCVEMALAVCGVHRKKYLRLGYTVRRGDLEQLVDSSVKNGR